MNLRNIKKKLLHESTSPIVFGEEKKEHYSKALKELINSVPELEDNKIMITKESSENPFDPKIKKIVDGYDLVNFELEKYGREEIKEIYPQDSLNNGDPIPYKPFPGCMKRLYNLRFSRSLHHYPSTVGTSAARQDLVDYLVKEGFPKEDNAYCNGVNVHNVAFASSTTQAFVLILKTIAKPHDTILLAAPTYGIFPEIAEKMRIHVETIPLKKENDYFMDPKDLKEKIEDVNKRLKEKYHGKDYVPKCVAYVNINPHNPIGNVMSKKHLPLIKEIGDVCLEEGVFIIDDLIYRDLTFDRENLAFPFASIPKYFNNTISLFGLSKSFGLASFRAAFVCMPTPVFWGYATEMFDLMDSISVMQVEAVRGAYNGSKQRERMVNRYFNKILPIYFYHLDLVNALIYGIDSVKKPETRRKILRDYKKYSRDPNILRDLKEGIQEIKICEKTYPQSGFFILVDFTKLKGKLYEGKPIETEYELLKSMYHFGKVRCLMGENIVWPNEKEFVARINFAVKKESLIHNFYQINQLVRTLKDGKN